jgi:hypothetical protein
MTERLLAGVAVLPFLMGAAFAPADERQVVTSFQDPEITESSGLVVDGEIAYTVNDSGDSGRVFAVDLRTGETVRVTRWSPEPTDVEALAPAGPDSLWVGDIGDNRAVRESIQLYEVPRDAPGVQASFVQPVELVYPDGPHDAETLMAGPDGRLYIATKGVLGGTLYVTPEPLRTDRPNVLEAVGPVLAIATDGAFLPDGEHLVIRNYTSAVVYDFPSMQRAASFPLPSQEQGEGIAPYGADRLLLSSEGVGAELLSVPLPALATPTPTPSPTASGHTTVSREDVELPETTSTERPAWPWFLSALVVVGMLAVLMRSLRRR